MSVEFIFIQLLSLLFVFIFFVSIFKHKFIAVFFALIGAVFITLQLSALYLGNSFIDLKYYLHFDLNQAYSLKGVFIKEIKMASIALLINSLLIFVLGYLFSKAKYYLTFGSILLVLSTYALLLEKGIFFEMRAIYNILSARSEKFETSLSKLNITNYKSPNEIEAIPGKNIIILSLESVEKEFFNERLIHLLPKMDSLRKENNFYEMKQVAGGGWTSASLYTYLTGFPAFFKGDGNAVFSTTFQTKITGISHILKKAGYDITYFMANPDFSGTTDLLKTYQVDIKSEKNIEGEFYKNEWGIYDKDLFEAAKKEILLKKENKKPFALMLSTMSTHPPDGIYDERFESLITPRKSKLEYQISATDIMVADFINFLKNEKLLENTVFYIFPDHLMLGKTFRVFEDFGENRELYLITNADKNDIKISTDSKIYQIDLPKIILNGANIKYNASFFTDYIKDEKAYYISNNKEILTSLNHSALIRDKELVDSTIFEKNQADIYFESKTEIISDKNRFIAHAGGTIENIAYTNSLEALDKSYNDGFRLFELDIIYTSDSILVAAHDWEHWAGTTNYIGKLPVSHKVFKNYKINKKFTPLDMNDINNWFRTHPDAILVTDKINEPCYLANKFVDKSRLIMELFSLKAVEDGIKCNILSAMPSENVLYEIEETKRLRTLKKLGIKHIAVSRRSIIPNKEMYLEFKKNGIKTYVFHVNHDEEKDEKYVIDNEMKYIYGMYADKWRF